MRRFFKISFVALALVVSVAGAAPVVHAANCTLENDVGSACSVGGVSGICSGNERDGYSCNTTGASGSTSFSQAAQQAVAATPANPTLGGTAADQFGSIMTWIMSLFAWLAGVAAMTLDYAAYYTVVTMGNYIHNLTAVGVTWRILRDIGNIMLIFGFLSVGLTTILNVDWYGFTTKMLPMLLVSAVFLNFSLFLTEAVIDTGNLFATQFVTQINGGTLPTLASLSQSTASNNGISNKIMAQLGFQTIYNPNTKDLNGGSTWLIGFMGIILFIVTAFVLFSLAFVLVARFVILLFLIIVSPIGWAALAIPKLRKLADMWWSELFEQTLTAPVLLLTLYVALAVITDAQFLTGFNSSSGAWLGYNHGNLPGFISILLSFLVAMGLLFGVVIFSKKLSAFGGDWATKTAGKLSFGAVAFAGRRTVGRASNFAARSIKSGAWGKRLQTSETGRLLAGVADRGAKATFDARGVKVFGGIKGGMGIEAGEPKAGGYRAREEELVKARTDYARSLTQSASQKEAIKKAGEVLGKEMEPLQEQEQKQLAETKKLVDASRAEVKLRKQEAKTARLSGDKNKIATAETALNSALRGQDDLKQEREEKIKPVRDEIAKAKKRYEDATKANSKEARQLAYGEGLEKKKIFGVVPRFPYDYSTATGSARQEAAKKIIADAGKDDAAKLRDLLQESLNKAAAPATAPAATKPA